MHRVDLDGGGNIEPGLLEAETKAAGAGEQVDPYGPHGAVLPPAIVIRSDSSVLAARCRSRFPGCPQNTVVVAPRYPDRGSRIAIP